MQPTPAFLPGESHRQRSLSGYSPWGLKEWDTTETNRHTNTHTHTHTHTHSYFKMFCQFLLYSKVSYTYIHTNLLFFIFFFHTCHYRVLSRVPSATHQVIISYLLSMQQCIYVNADLPVYPIPPFFSLSNCKFIFYICDSISAL